ncbi:MAG: PQQ-binding-like beta-propeller repeat protein [Candidatus Methanofastidiosia archaeon]|jgi:outer membrane protein assembly factor BamB
MNTTAKKGFFIVIVVVVVGMVYYGYKDHNGEPDITDKKPHILWDVTLEHSLVIPPHYIKNCIVAITKDDISVFDVETGTKKWSNPVTPLGVTPQYINGLLLIGTERGVAAYNFDTGENVWDKSFGGGGYCSFTGQYMVVDTSTTDTNVYVGTPEPAVYNLDAATGNIIWEYTYGLQTCPQLQLVGTHILVYSEGIQCISQENGELIWHVTDYMPGIEFYGDVLLVKGVDKNGKFYHGLLQSESGEMMWQEYKDIFHVCYKNETVYYSSENTVEGVKIGKRESWEYPYQGVLQDILPVDTGVVLILYTESHSELVVLNNNGQKIWTFKENTGSSAVYVEVFGNTLGFVAETGVIEGVDIKSGEKLWSTSFDTPVKIGDILLYTDKIFVSTHEGVYSFDIATGEPWWEYSVGHKYEHALHISCVDDILLVYTPNRIMCIHLNPE